ncbi:MAG: prolyl oligopeptidase family serine peptidase [Planctomycetota bacterium]|jgi:hypothetical protein
MEMTLLPNIIGGIVLAAVAAAAPAAAQKGQWQSPVLGKALPTELSVPPAEAPGASRHGRPCIIYLKNLSTPRVGRERDESILADFLKDGYVVLAIDYGRDGKAVAPHINHDLRIIRHQLKSSDGQRGLFAGQEVDQDHTYILPAGYRLARDILYYDEPRGLRFRLDIRYPSKAERPVPAVVQIPVENARRMDNKVIWLYNDLIAEGFLTRGYAAVQVDNPIRHYKGIDHMPEVAYKLKAAIRTVRAKAKQCNIDAEHIGVMGFSRASGQAGILAMSGGMEKLEKGPHLDYSSRVQAALLHAGRMDHLALLMDCPQVGRQYLDAWGDPEKNLEKWKAHSAISYVTRDDPPTFLSVGQNDWYRVKQIGLMGEALKAAGVEHKHVVTPGLGHEVTSNIKVLEEIYEFFDEHLRACETESGAEQKVMTSKPLERMKRFKMKQFLIGSWCFRNPYTEAYCRAYKSAGFNTMVDSPNALDSAARTGLNVIITTIVHPVCDEDGKEIPGRYKLGPYARLPELKWFQERFSRHPALVGYLLNDNCKLEDFTIECAKWLKDDAPQLFAYMSHNPDPAGQAKVVSVMPILSSQNYPFGYRNNWPEPKKRRAFCDRLEADRAHANENDMTPWPIFAVFGDPALGASQIRFQAFSSIAYGAQGIFYFAYSGHRPVWKKDGTVYLATKYCNDYIVPVVGPRVLGCRSVGVYHTPLEDDVPEGALAAGARKLIEEMDDGLLAGVLVAEEDFKAGRELPAYVMVVDKRTASDRDEEPQPRTVRVTFGRQVKTVQVLPREGEPAEPSEGRAVSLTLKAGEGMLLRIEPADAAGGR